MTRIGCRAHDYGKLPAAELAAVLHAKGYTGAQLAMPRGIAGIADFAHITEEQLAEIRTAFAAQDVEISVLSCYQDLSAPDADARRAAVDAVKRTLGYAKVLGAKMVGSETAPLHGRRKGCPPPADARQHRPHHRGGRPP